VQEKTLSVEQPYVTSATAMLSTLQCAPTILDCKFILRPDCDSKQKPVPRPNSSFPCTFPSIWCGASNPVSPTNGCRRLAGQCTKADSLAFALCPIEEHEHKSPAVWPCAMHECLTRKTSQFRPLSCFKQGARPASTGSNDTSNLPRATSQLLHDN